MQEHRFSPTVHIVVHFFTDEWLEDTYYLLIIGTLAIIDLLEMTCRNKRPLTV